MCDVSPNQAGGLGDSRRTRRRRVKSDWRSVGTACGSDTYPFIGSLDMACGSNIDGTGAWHFHHDAEWQLEGGGSDMASICLKWP